MYYTDDGESFDSTNLSKGTVNGYQFYFTGACKIVHRFIVFGQLFCH